MNEAPHDFDKTEKTGAAVCVCGFEAPGLYDLLPHIGEGNREFHLMKKGELCKSQETKTTRRQ
ncbi:hypothetical protein CCP3SC15_360011 [Gammaproteobacteria bacterium]